MRQRVRMWGNSLSVRIPKAIAEELHLQSNAEVEMTMEGASLVIRRVEPQYNLDDLLSQVTPENVHEETSWGDATGKEVW